MIARALTGLRRNAIALLALGIALGGTAYAAGKIHSNQIATNAVKSKQLSPKAITAKHGVIRTKRIAVNDPTTAGPTSKVLLRSGPFKLTAACSDASATQSVSGVQVSSSVRAWIIGNGGVQTYLPAGDSDSLPDGVGSATEGAESAAVFIVEKRGRFLNVAIHVARKPLGENVDCAYTVVGFGR